MEFIARRARNDYYCLPAGCEVIIILFTLSKTGFSLAVNTKDRNVVLFFSQYYILSLRWFTFLSMLKEILVNLKVLLLCFD